VIAAATASRPGWRGLSARHYSELAATVCRSVANANTELAAIKAGRRP